MKNIFKSKRNILIMMFALIVIMGIGFAAYSQQLQIKDTSSIDSNWDIYISNVTPGTKESGTLVGGATGTGAPDEKIKTKANLTTDLKYPGDSITYTIDVTNGGTVDAEVEKVDLKPLKENTVIKYSIIDEANIQYLNAGDTKSFKVKVEYDPTKTGTATEEEKSNTLTLTIDYVQKGAGAGTYVPGESTFTGVVYSSNLLDYYENGNSDNINWKKENYIWPGDFLKKIKGYTEDYTALNNEFLLKHTIDNGKVVTNEACFIKDGLHCMIGGDGGVAYEANKSLLLSIFGESACYIKNSGIRCIDGSTDIYADADGFVQTGGDIYACMIDDTDIIEIGGNGGSGCITW